MTDQTLIKIHELVNVLNKANNQYYNEGNSDLTDYEFDSLYRKLVELETTHPEYNQPNSPTQQVGFAPASLTPSKHLVKLHSLANTYTPADLLEYLIGLGKSANDVHYTLELKFDGIAAAVYYKDFKLDRVVTRGDGEIGEDITDLIRTCKILPLVIPTSHGFGDFTINGEVILTKLAFSKMNDLRESRGEKLFSNARNAVAGIVRTGSGQTPPPLSLIVYGVQYPDHHPETSASANLLALAGLGFNISQTISNDGTYDEILKSVEWVEQHRAQIPYDIDGLVIKVDSLLTRETLGTTAKYPKWATAYKFPAVGAMTTLLEVEWQTGRTGAITPVAIVEPIKIGGVVIGRVNLHNHNVMANLGLTHGCFVSIERKGDVIPQITSAHPSDESSIPVTYPSHCPSCGAPVSDTLTCEAPTFKCNAKAIASLVLFTGRSGMNIKGLGESNIRYLVDVGILTSLGDIYRTNYLDFGVKIADKIKANVERSKSPTLAKFISALGIPNVGQGAANKLALTAGTLEQFKQMTYESLSNINGIGEATVLGIVDYLQTNTDITDLQSLGVTPI